MAMKDRLTNCRDMPTFLWEWRVAHVLHWSHEQVDGYVLDCLNLDKMRVVSFVRYWHQA
jgi:hypothetical protein